tara:strand:+ start:1793 stop:2002 length:210 start_codon:yes stop_codon:yes gene_type:complete
MVNMGSIPIAARSRTVLDNTKKENHDMILSFSGSDIRNSTEEELRESMRQQIQEQTTNKEEKEEENNDD